MKDILVLAALVLSFATMVTIHVALSVRLVLHQRPRWRGLVAFIPPIAEIWALRVGFRRSALVWLVAMVVYIVARLVAQV